MLWIVIFHSLIFLSFIIWLLSALMPDKAYKYTEIFNPKEKMEESQELPHISVLIPARNEEEVLPETLPFIAKQDYPHLEVILIDDHSTDKTREVAQKIQQENNLKDILKIVSGKELEEGWAGKMWALHQGHSHAKGDWLLFTDADIYYPPGMLKSLVLRAIKEDRAMISLMARLRTKTFWEKLLIPAFLYFFKMLYPFRAVKDDSRKVAAAAGGCVFIKRNIFEDIGGFHSIKDALIDDVTLAKTVKGKGNSILLMNGPTLLSKRGYDTLGGLWKMVSRSAFTELEYSYLKLLGCFIAMTIAFVVPFIGMFSPFFFSISSFTHLYLLL